MVATNTLRSVVPRIKEVLAANKLKFGQPLFVLQSSVAFAKCLTPSSTPMWVKPRQHQQKAAPDADLIVVKTIPRTSGEGTASFHQRLLQVGVAKHA
jgi:hypothetical protein